MHKHRISKQFTFEAAHKLDLGSMHKCSRLHGHSYRVEVELSGRLNAQKMVKEFGQLGDVRHYIDTHFDHRYLNEILDVPTAENIALHLFKWIKRRHKELETVRVWETASCWAECSR